MSAISRRPSFRAPSRGPFYFALTECAFFRFTISSASEPYAEALNFSSIDAPRGTNEFALTGLTPVRSLRVGAPRVKEAPFSMECKLDLRKEYYADHFADASSAAEGQQQDPAKEKDKKLTTVVVIARVVALHIREDCISPEDGSIDLTRTLPVSRVAGMLYTRATHGFELERPKWAQHKDSEPVRRALEREAEVQIVERDFEDPVLPQYP